MKTTIKTATCLLLASFLSSVNAAPVSPDQANPVQISEPTPAHPTEIPVLIAASRALTREGGRGMDLGMAIKLSASRKNATPEQDKEITEILARQREIALKKAPN